MKERIFASVIGQKSHFFDCRNLFPERLRKIPAFAGMRKKNKSIKIIYKSIKKHDSINIKIIIAILVLTNLLFFNSANLFPQNKFQTSSEKFKFYKEKYKVDCLPEKITDNHGNGFDSLYGTRNMRTVLYGVAYRGGANNFFHKTNKRDNHNPLPEDGLINLCKQSFSSAVYLYSTNFSESEKTFINSLTNDTLQYMQNSGMSRNSMKIIMNMILDVINTSNKGPIYFHCWNGWHQSGYISAAILKQFCNFSDEQAYDYWIENTDGVNKGYEKVKKLVRDFKPFDDIKINDSIRKEICPCQKN